MRKRLHDWERLMAELDSSRVARPDGHGKAHW